MNLISKAKNVRRKIVTMTSRSNSSHIGAALSTVEVLVALYFSAMKINPSNPNDLSRDRFLLSKGHACSALYATLSERGLITDEELEKFATDGGVLPGHATLALTSGIEASTGSLGHGLSLGIGFSLGARIDGAPYRTFVLLGDGECDEGSVWEASMFAGNAKLDNLIAIIDYNKLQSFGRTKEVLDLEPLAKKWEAFGWSVREVDGHDLDALVKLLNSVPFKPEHPTLIIAHTIKGKGISFTEDRLEWHYKSLNPEQKESALEELK